MGSEMFAKSIMNQVEVRVISGYFNPETSAELILAMSNVPGDANTAVAFFQTIERIYNHEETNEEVRPALLRSILRMTLKAPILFDPVLHFMQELQSFEGIQILSRKFPIPQSTLKWLSDILRNGKQERESDETHFIMTISNQFLLFDSDFLAQQTLRPNWIVLDKQFQLDQNCMFISGTYLYLICEKKVQVQEFVNSVGLKRIESLFQRSYDQKKLKEKFMGKCEVLMNMLTQNKEKLVNQTLFYIARDGSSSDQLELTKKVILNKDRVSVHNFISSFLTKEIAQFALENLKNDQELLLDIATRHFTKSYDFLPFLVTALNEILNTDQSKRSMIGQEISHVCMDANVFYSRSFIDQYLSVCLDLCQITLDLSKLDLKDTQCETILLKLYLRAQESSNRTSQVLQKFTFAGRNLLELPYGPIQKDATQEAYPHFMLYQVGQLILQKIYKLMVQVSSVGPDAEINNKKECEELNKVERKFERTFLIDVTKLAFGIPRQMFKLSVPPFSNIELCHQQQWLASDSTELRPKRDQNLILKVSLTPSQYLAKNVGIHLSMSVLQYHGAHFEWKESEVTQSCSKNFIIKKEDERAEETLLLSFPSMGNYLIRLSSHLYQVDTQRLRQYGVETKRFVKVKIE